MRLGSVPGSDFPWLPLSVGVRRGLEEPEREPLGNRATTRSGCASGPRQLGLDAPVLQVAFELVERPVDLRAEVPPRPVAALAELGEPAPDERALRLEPCARLGAERVEVLLELGHVPFEIGERAIGLAAEILGPRGNHTEPEGDGGRRDGEPPGSTLS